MSDIINITILFKTKRGAIEVTKVKIKRTVVILLGTMEHEVTAKHRNLIDRKSLCFVGFMIRDGCVERNILTVRRRQTYKEWTNKKRGRLNAD